MKYEFTYIHLYAYLNVYLIGFIAWEIIDDEVISFGPFAVKKEFNGKGLGKALVSKVEDIGRQKQMKRIEIFILNHRGDLFPLYEKWGFKDTGRVADWSPDAAILVQSIFQRDSVVLGLHNHTCMWVVR